MYNAPSIKNGSKIYRIHSSIKRRTIFILLFILIISYFGIMGFSINAKSPAENILAYFLFGSLMMVCLWIAVQSFVFSLKLTAQGGTLYLLGKTIEFDWQDAMTFEYVYWKGDNKAQLSLCLTRSKVKKRFYLDPKYFFPIQIADNLIPLDSLYRQKSFLSLNTKHEPPTPDECSIHLRYFLRTPMGEDIIQYAPQVLSDVLHKYLPDNDLNTSF